MNDNIQTRLIAAVEKKLKIKMINSSIPPQGMNSEVFFITDELKNEYAIKYSENAASDFFTYKILNENKVKIPTPKVFTSFEFDGKTVLVLEKINFPLLETVPVAQMHRYIPSMVKNLKKIHAIKSTRAGLLGATDKNSTWKNFLLSKFNNQYPKLNWMKIAKRKSLDGELILSSVKKIQRKIETFKFNESSHCLLHIDFNQRNLFVNPKPTKSRRSSTGAKPCSAIRFMILPECECIFGILIWMIIF